MSYDTFRGNRGDAAALRQMAADCRQRSADSFARSDTDGCLSQWASDMSASLYERQAHIAENGGLCEFTGLYKGDTRIAAKEITVPAYNRPWAKDYVWILRDDAAKELGRKFIPVGDRSRIQKTLGLCQRQELAPGVAYIGGSGTGLSGCASAFVSTRRTGDEWGMDARVAP